jgi:TrwC relaxase
VVADIAKLSVGREAYYTRELATDHQAYLSGHGESPGRWYGNGARSLGLQGEASVAGFQAMFEGRHPDTDELLGRPHGKARCRRSTWCRHPLAADAIYRATYQRTLSRTLGVEWTPADAHGNREFQGMPEDLVRGFSKRAGQIDAELDRLAADGQGWTPRLVKWTVHTTRKPKQHETPDTLYGRWRAEATERGVDADTLVREVTGRTPNRDQDRPVSDVAVGRLFDRLAGPDGLTAEASTFIRPDVLVALGARRAGLLRLLDTPPRALGHPGPGRRAALDHRGALPDRQGPGRPGLPPGSPLALLVPLDHPGHGRPRLPGGPRGHLPHPPPTTGRADRVDLQRAPAPVRGAGHRPAGDLGHRLRWSLWRRRHQARARTCDYLRQAAPIMKITISAGVRERR